MGVVYAATHVRSLAVAVRCCSGDRPRREGPQALPARGVRANRVEHKGGSSRRRHSAAMDIAFVRGASGACSTRSPTDRRAPLDEMPASTQASRLSRRARHRPPRHQARERLHLRRRDGQLPISASRRQCVATSGAPDRHAGAARTPAFMPPEQALAHWDRVGPHSDVRARRHDASRCSPDSCAGPHRPGVRVSTQQARPVRAAASLPAPIADVIDRAPRSAPRAVRRAPCASPPAWPSERRELEPATSRVVATGDDRRQRGPELEVRFDPRLPERCSVQRDGCVGGGATPRRRRRRAPRSGAADACIAVRPRRSERQKRQRGFSRSRPGGRRGFGLGAFFLFPRVGRGGRRPPRRPPRPRWPDSRRARRLPPGPGFVAPVPSASVVSQPP
jgi:hypothetical protein